MPFPECQSPTSDSQMGPSHHKCKQPLWNWDHSRNFSTFSVLVRSLVQNRLNFPGICYRNGLSPPLNMSSWPPGLGPHPYASWNQLCHRGAWAGNLLSLLACYLGHLICPHAHSLTHRSSTEREDKEGKKQDDPASRP